MKMPLVLHSTLLVATYALVSCDPPQDAIERDSSNGLDDIETTTQSTEPGDAIIAKLEGIIIPVIDFENTSVEEAIDYLRVRSIELDKGGNTDKRGISILIRKPKVEEDEPNDGNDLLIIGDGPLHSRIAQYGAKNISLLEALIGTCKHANLDAYLTSVGFVICPKGHPPFPNSKAQDGEIWKHLTAPDSP